MLRTAVNPGTGELNWSYLAAGATAFGSAGEMT